MNNNSYRDVFSNDNHVFRSNSGSHFSVVAIKLEKIRDPEWPAGESVAQLKKSGTEAVHRPPL